MINTVVISWDAHNLEYLVQFMVNGKQAFIEIHKTLAKSRVQIDKWIKG